MHAVYTVPVTDGVSLGAGVAFADLQLFPLQPACAELLAFPLLPDILSFLKPEKDPLPLYEAVKSGTFINISLTEVNCEPRGHAVTFYAGSDIIVYMDFEQLFRQ